MALILRACLAAALLPVGCGQTEPAPKPAPFATDHVAASGVKLDFGGSEADHEEYGRFLSGVRTLLDQYWQSMLSQEHLSYRTPNLVLYRPGARDGWQRCGPSDSGAAPRAARYCGERDELFFNNVFMYDAWRRIGDAAPAVVVAHEWGHAIQQRLSHAGRQYEAEQRFNDTHHYYKEWQADCFAGAWIGWMQQQKRIDPGDYGEIEVVFFEGRDDRPTRFEERDGHGKFMERLGAYRVGARQGWTSCSHRSYPAPERP